MLKKVKDFTGTESYINPQNIDFITAARGEYLLELLPAGSPEETIKSVKEGTFSVIGIGSTAFYVEGDTEKVKTELGL